MNALTLLLALLVMGCAAIEGEMPALDRVMDRAMRAGGCVKAVCFLPIESIRDCGPSVGSCQP